MLAGGLDEREFLRDLTGFRRSVWRAPPSYTDSQISRGSKRCLIYTRLSA